MARAKAPRAKPHARAKAAARDRETMDPDVAWAQDLDRRMLADCHPFQRDAVLDPSRRVALLVGRGGGKTTSKRVRALRKTSRIRRARVAYVATSRPEAERLNWEPLKELIDQLAEMDNFEFIESKMICRCKKTGGEYQFFGADDKKEINKLRGQPFNEFQVDEAASHDITLLDLLLDRAIGPRLGERQGGIVLGGSPGHILRGRFYDVTRDGSDKHRPYRERDQFPDWIGWSSHAWNMLDILELPRARERYPALVANWEEALVEKERQGWTDDNPVWRREYLGKWAADNTTTMYQYRAFAEDGKTRLNSWDPLDGKKLDLVPTLEAAIKALPGELSGWVFGYGQDLGSRDPYALDIFALSPTDQQRRMWHVGWFDRRKMYPSTIAEVLIGPEAAEKARRGEVYKTLGGAFGVTGWPVANVADLAGLGEMVLDELAQTYGIRIKAAEKKNKFGAIEVFNGDLVDVRMFILAGSPLEEQLSSLQWKPDEYGQPKEDKGARNDHADAATYIRTELGGMFSAAPPTKPKPDAEKTAKPERDRDRAKPAPKDDRWNDSPVRSRTSGEFDSLLANSDFTGMDWGND